MSFKTMRLIEEGELERLRQAAVREYNPVTHTLANLKDELDQIEKRTDIDPDQKLLMYSSLKSKYEAFQNVPSKALERELNPEPKVPLAAVAAQPAISVTPIPPSKSTIISLSTTALPGPTDEAPVLNTVVQQDLVGQSNDVENSILKRYNIPKQYRNKFTSLYHHLENHKDILATNINGELVVQGESIEGSSWIDLIRNLYIQNKNYNLHGLDRFIDALIKVQLPIDYISNSEVTTRFLMPAKVTKISNYSIRSQSGKGKVTPPGIHVKVLRLYK